MRTAPHLEARDWLERRSDGPMAPGAVLFHAPSHVFQAPGGGEVQLVRTGQHLEARGVEVRLFRPWVDRLEDARLLHLFGMSREGLELARVAVRRGVPVVLSPICWFEPRALLALAPGPLRGALDLARWSARRLAGGLPCWRRELLRLATAVLPNSEAEARQLRSLFGARLESTRPVPNGVEPELAGAEPGLFRERYGDEPFVLYAGRVEPRKGVLELIRGLGPTGLPLVVLGAAPPGCEGYLETCRQAGGSGVRWLGRFEPDDPMLPSAYAAARVLALTSWFETPGLAALEAALAGSAVVVTPYGCTREYFGDLVGYARPGRPGEIAREVERAWRRGPHPELAGHVARHFTWSEVARRTAEVYDQVAG